MNTILLVEDNPHIMNINIKALMMHDYYVLTANNAEECCKILHSSDVDLIVLDIILPDGNGVELCSKIKEQYDIPVLFLSAMSENEDIIAGLRAGGDDYLTKPYDLEILLARIEARIRNNKTNKRYVFFDKLKLDTVSMCGYFNETDLLLTQKEFSVLLLLVKNAGNILSKKTLYCEVWGGPMCEDSRALYTVVCRLKKKLSVAESDITISIRRSEGYVLEKI